MKSILTQVEDYSVFTSMVGYAGAAIATVYALWALLWKGGVWTTPQDILPRQARGLLGVILVAGMVLIYLDIRPGNLEDYKLWLKWFVGIAVGSFILFFSLIRGLSYDTQAAITSNSTRKEKILGGFWMLASAKESMKHNNVPSVQKLLSGALYDPNLIWSRLSQEVAKNTIIFLYLALVSCGTLGLTTAAFMIQVSQTGKAASAVVQ